MEPGALLQPPALMHDYSLSSDHDYNDAFAPHHHHHHHHHQHHQQHPQQHAHHHPSPSVGASVLQHGPPTFTFSPPSGVGPTRYLHDRETSSYHTSSNSNNFADSASGGSISNSPSSASSSLAYTTYPPQHCPTISNFSAPVQLPQAFVPAAYASTRVLPVLDSAGSAMPPPPNPLRSPITSSPSVADRDAFANSTSFPTRASIVSPHACPFPSFPDTPRSALSVSSLSLSNQPAHYPAAQAHMASATHFGPSADCSGFPWPDLVNQSDMFWRDQVITPDIQVKVDKGFFQSNVDGKWTCYRRNYFSVTSSFSLHPSVPIASIQNCEMTLKRHGSDTMERIRCFGLRLTAAVDGPGGKSIDLIQHTPKRDNGPKNKIEIIQVSPMNLFGQREPAGAYSVAMSMDSFQPTGQTAGSYLKYHNTHEQNASAADLQSVQASSNFPYNSQASQISPTLQTYAHTFERVQFKQATANNGKRRASQQYFHLIAELFANVQKEGDAKEVWVKVVTRTSDKIVVRGRSPSHYAHEGQPVNGRTGSSGGNGGYTTSTGAGYGGNSSMGYRAGSSSGYPVGLAGGTYRTNGYGYSQSPENSGSSSPSANGGAADAEYPVMTDAERDDIQAQDGYRYYPAPLYDNMAPGSLPLPKIEAGVRYTTDPSTWAIKSEYNDALQAGSQWPTHGLSRFQGVETSRGYYPDLPNNYS